MGGVKKNKVARATVSWETVQKNFLDMVREKHQKEDGLAG